MHFLLRLCLPCFALAATLAACGGGSSSSTGNSSTPAQVTGIATPKTVSVVTAN